MKMHNPRMHAEHAFPVERNVSSLRAQRAKSLFWSFMAILALVFALALAHKADMTAEVEEAVIAQRIADAQSRAREDQVWLKRMAVAYQQGRTDALVVAKASPEERELALACASLPRSKP